MNDKSTGITVNTGTNTGSHTGATTNKMKSDNQYVKLKNYRGHLNTDPNQLHFGEINAYSLPGIILKISNKNDNNLQKYYTLCDSMIECIGFSIHPTIGVLFHNHTSFPLQYVRNWNFYIKNRVENKKYEMKQFINKRINYAIDLLCSSTIPSLSSLDILYSVPIIPRQFMSFEWNMGRTNNQLYSLEAMLQHAVIYLRTLILPFTTHRNHDIGMLKNDSLSIWDMLKLSELIDYIFEYEFTPLSIPNMNTWVITDNNDIIYDIKNTFDITINTNDLKWKEYFEQQIENKNSIINEPNWNLISLLEYRMFTNNIAWTLSHENKIHNDWDKWKCFVTRGARDKVPHNTLLNCRNIHFCLGRYAHFKLDDWPIFDVLHFIIPSLRLRNAVDNTIKFWFEQPQYYRIGLHRRAMKEGGTDSTGTPYVCRYKMKSLSKSGRYAGLRRHIEAVIKMKFGNDLKQEDINIKTQAITDLYDRSCAIDFDTINQVLKFHKQRGLGEKVFWDSRMKEYKQRKEQIEPWFLACDNQEPEILNEFIGRYGAITLNGKSLADYKQGKLYWNKDKEMMDEQRSYTEIIEKQYLKYLKIFQDENELKREYKLWMQQLTDQHQQRWYYDISKIEMWRKEIVVFDMWMLKQSQFFVGSWHSTLTRNVCHWRGYKNMYNSTNCYLTHKWRAMYETQHKVPIDGDWGYNWFDIDAVDKPLLTWEDVKK